MAVVKFLRTHRSTCVDPLHWHFYDSFSGTFSHLIACPVTLRAALIDPVLGFAPASARINTSAAEQIAAVIRAERLALDWVLETHIHADHVSAAQFFRMRFGAQIGIGASVCAVQAICAQLFDLQDSVVTDGSQFDRLWRDDERFDLGQLEVRVIATPGHTLDGVTYLVGSHAFIGDTVFRADFGTARCDFAGGDASTLFDSIKRLYSLVPSTVLHFCHDYPPCEAPPTERAYVDDMRFSNVHMTAATRREEFVALRRSRDAKLPVPALMIPAVQLNIAAGKLPTAAGNGIAYLKLPLNCFGA
jgi:glyoxylase-like metal-dependent hydrolase (beta-lactamase superfamily II)